MNNRQNFHILEDFKNLDVTSISRYPAHTLWNAYENEEQAIAGERYSSKYLKMLNGTYRFRLYDSPNEVDDFFSPDYNDREFSDINVPSNWELEGFGEPIYTNYDMPWDYESSERYMIKPSKDSVAVVNPPHIPGKNPTGCYRFKFDLPKDFDSRRVFLTFEGVETAYYLWINGHPVGYSQDSKLPSEFEVSRYLKESDNLMALQVMKFADCSYMEDQDYWHLCGIFRNVYLVSKPKIAIEDVYVTALPNLYTKQGVVNIDVTITREEFYADHSVKVSVYSDEGSLLKSTVGKVTAESQYSNYQLADANTARVSLDIEDINLWSPESPNLYTAVFTLINPNGVEVDFESCRFGFRCIEIKNGVLFLNGKRLIIRGVNRHEHNPLSGRALTKENMLADIIEMKRMNINSVRTSHYPNSPIWYDLCDRYGILIVCETNLETHGVLGMVSHNPQYLQSYVERCMRMVMFYKNHPCIYSWSLGNESGFGVNHAAMYGFVKEYDKHRLCQYECGDPEKNISDVRGKMYASIEEITDLLGSATDDRPIILVEFLYQIRNSGGGAEKFSYLTEKYPRFQGGYVWDWQDKYISKKNGDKVTCAHGGDFGESVVERFLPPFMVNNGVVMGDLRWKPVAHELKQVYSPVVIEKQNSSSAWFTLPQEGHYTIKNLSTDLLFSELDCHARLLEDGVLIEECPVELPNVAPGEKADFLFSFDHEKKDGAEYHLDFTVVRKNKTFYSEERFPIGRFQFELIQNAVKHKEYNLDIKLETKFQGDMLVINSDRFEVVISAKTGRIDRLIKEGCNYITFGPSPCFTRPYCGLDAYENWGWREHFATAESLELQEVTLTHLADSSQCVFAEFLLDYTNAVVNISYLVTCESISVKVNYHFSGSVLAIPRAGVELVLPKGFDEIEYFGRGETENYCDRKQSAFLGVYRSTVSDQHFPYAPPSENGGHEDTRRLSVFNADNGIHFTAQKPFHFDIHNYTIDDIKDCMHDEDIPIKDENVLHIDCVHFPIGDDMAWSIAAPKEFTPTDKAYCLDFVIELD